MTLATHPAVAAAVAASPTVTRHDHHDTVGSTNDLAARALRGAAPGGVLVTADRQTAGRGRAGRSWTDDVLGPTGPANLAVSLAIDTPPAPGPVPLAAGLAVAHAYRAAGADPALKWPNDVLLDGRKAAGILVERHDLAGRDVVVIGCGLDIDWRGVVRTGDAQRWTSLAEALGGAVDRGAVLAALIAGLDASLAALDDLPALLERYVAACDTIGRQVEVTLPGGATLAGRATGVDRDGLLVVDTGRDRVQVRAGDVTVTGP